jgi:hypothetical protein
MQDLNLGPTMNFFGLDMEPGTIDWNLEPWTGHGPTLFEMLCDF